MTARAHIHGHPVHWNEEKQKWIGAARTCAHCKLMPILVSVVIPSDLSHTGKIRRTTKPIDACIADIVRLLNAGDKPMTRGSCCGHGKGPPEILLQDGRRLILTSM